jgi:hypothetical protein
MTAEVAPLEQRKKAAGAGVGVVLLAGVVALAVAGRGGGGNGAGPSQPQGAIGSVTLSTSSRQALSRGRAPMGQELVKGVGDKLKAAFSLTFSTKDSEGNAIGWPYRWVTQVFELGANTPILQASGAGTHSNRTINVSHTFTLSSQHVAPGDQLVVVVRLEAAESDLQGKPLDTGAAVILDVAQGDRLVLVEDTSNGGDGCPTPVQVGTMTSFRQWVLTSWQSSGNCTWITQPELHILGGELEGVHLYQTPKEYRDLLQQIKSIGTTGPVDQYIAEFEAVFPEWGLTP